MLHRVKTLLTLILFTFPMLGYSMPYNIILIISDQETNQLIPATNYTLPARAAIAEHGVTFQNHYNAAAMCTPSRAAFLTGTPPQVNGEFDQMEYSFVPTLNPKRPNVASVLKKLGYHTAYFGKFEMDKTILANKPTVNYSTLATAYGIDEFNTAGDTGGTPQQAYSLDSFYVGEAVQWLKKNAASTNSKGEPFFLVVSLLNPHDIMYADVNIPGTPQAQKPAAPRILPPPATILYRANWEFPLVSTLHDNLTAPGMPAALNEYQQGWSGTLGFIPTDREDMWHVYYNYYLNALRDNDQNLQLVVDTLNQMDLWKNTIVIFTADHGDMGGAHGGLRGKGPMAYEQNSHIPLIIAHPKAAQHTTTQVLTSHIDLLPTIAGLTGLPKAAQQAAMGPLTGRDFSFLLTTPTTNIHAVRQAVLFNYVGISTVDGNYLRKTLTASITNHTLPSLTEVNLSKRGFMSFIFDGRYKYARYYAPNAFNTPKTLAEILKYNDIQLFDLQNDPDEKTNLALDTTTNEKLILRMNGLMNDLMAIEVGTNDGHFLPDLVRPKTKPLTFND